MFPDYESAPMGVPNLYIHTVHQPEINSASAKLRDLHSRAMDVQGLCYDDLARQILVRDLRAAADDLNIQDFVSTWSYDELAGKLVILFEFGSAADMVLYKLRVG